MESTTERFWELGWLGLALLGLACLAWRVLLGLAWLVLAEGAAAADDAKNKPGQAKQARPSQASQAKSGLAKPPKPKGGHGAWEALENMVLLTN